MKVGCPHQRILMISLKTLLLASVFVLSSGCTRQKSHEFFANRRLERDQQAVGLPSIYIDVEPEMLDSIHQSQKIKIDADARLITPNKYILYEGSIKIKTRGNYSFYGFKSKNKKPYSIELPFKQNLLGLYRDDEYTLLANGIDGEEYMCNALAFELAQAIGLPTTKAVHIHLYTNGQYRGIYQITNKVAIHPDYLPLHDLGKDNKWVNAVSPKKSPIFCIDQNGVKAYRKGVQLEYNPEDITGGYLLDHSLGDAFEKSPSGFYSNQGLPFRIRDPKYASKEEVDYIADFYNQLEEAVYSLDGYNTRTGKHYSQYMDIESFARYYLIQELLMQGDAGAGSFIMYKNADEIDSLMHAGPIWDFDGFDRDFDFVNALYVSEKIGINESGYGFFYYLSKHHDFQEKVKEIYVQELYPAINELYARNYFDSLQTLLVLNDTTVAEFVRQRSDFLYWLWSADSAEVVQVKLYNTAQTSNGLKRTYKRLTIPFYGNRIEGVKLPRFPYKDSEDPTPDAYYLCDSNTPLPIDTVFHSNQVIKIQWREPSKFEIMCRVIQKIINKMISPI